MKQEFNKQSFKTWIILVISFLVITQAKAQAKPEVSVTLSTLQYIVGFFIVIAGFFSTWMTMKNGLKLAEFEKDVYKRMNEHEMKMAVVVQDKIDKLSLQVSGEIKDLRSEMYTKEDSKFLNENIRLQFELMNTKLNNESERTKEHRSRTNTNE